MKKLAIILLSALLLLTGCARSRTVFTEPVIFYYPQSEFQFGEESGVIGFEEREAVGHSSDLTYLLTLYFSEPVDDSLVNPFPEETGLIGIQEKDGTLTVELSPASHPMTDSRYALACSCLAKTCMEIGNFQSVVVLCGNRTATIQRDGMLMYDEWHD